MPNVGASPGLPGIPHTQDLVVMTVNCIVLSYFSLKGKTPSGMFSRAATGITLRAWDWQSTHPQL